MLLLAPKSCARRLFGWQSAPLFLTKIAMVTANEGVGRYSSNYGQIIWSQQSEYFVATVSQTMQILKHPSLWRLIIYILP